MIYSIIYAIYIQYDICNDICNSHNKTKGTKIEDAGVKPLNSIHKATEIIKKIVSHTRKHQSCF